MTDTPELCPFCGADWTWRDDGYVHGRVARTGLSDWDEFCPLQGMHLLPCVVPRYNCRVEQAREERRCPP